MTRGLNGCFSKDNIQVYDKIIREMKIKNSMRYHLILVRIAIVKKERETSVGENVEKSEALLTVGRK